LEGQIERITYANEETGYTVAKVKVKGRRDSVTIVGQLMAVTPGEVLSMQGEWSHHSQYGEQFKVTRYLPRSPATIQGIQMYLGSGLIKGIGPVMAKRMVQAFGQDTLDIIAHQADRLLEVDGLGPKRVAMIRTAWAEQKEIRRVMIFLQDHGVSAGHATRIFKQYGDAAVEVLLENPYRLARDIHGIGFVTADRIAEKIGVPKDSPIRALAGLLHVLYELAGDGHVYFPYSPLLKKCREMLEVDPERIVEAIGAAAAEQAIVIEDLNENLECFQENNKAVYLSGFYTAETKVAERLAGLLKSPKRRPAPVHDAILESVDRRLGFKLAGRQKEAVLRAARDKVLVITGGPGTGKTTIIKAILALYSKSRAEILLAAPTGRAAKRMSEATGFEAKTIHRLLEFNPGQGGFKKNDQFPLDCDLLIIDEVSMIDIVLMHHLLKATPIQATVILVGDVDQLPSVGPGNVLKDIITSNRLPTVRLNDIFRQARESTIVVNAHAINRGQMPEISHSPDKLEDFYFIERPRPEDALDTIVELVTDRIPKRFSLDRMDDLQVISPMHRGLVGTENLNLALQKALNPSNKSVIKGGWEFRVQDKVMQTKNNYDKDVFNGDIGRIVDIDQELREVAVDFEGRRLGYDYHDLDELILAYAISVHKSQGSEYPAIIMPVLTQHYLLLQRNLVYTAVTRGKRLVVLVGSYKALGIAIRNNRPQNRFTRLSRRIERASDHQSAL
jgi:exodeoxyribonuclease V alpha subunit